MPRARDPAGTASRSWIAASRRRSRALPGWRLPTAGHVAAKKEGARGGTMGSPTLRQVVELQEANAERARVRRSRLDARRHAHPRRGERRGAQPGGRPRKRHEEPVLLAVGRDADLTDDPAPGGRGDDLVGREEALVLLQHDRDVAPVAAAV